MENVDIARVLRRIAELLEIQAANPFRVRAYANAARIVEGYSRPFRAMVEAEEDLTAIKGIGKDLAGHIRELVTTGRSSVLEELEGEVPPSVAELTHVPGVGPKRARTIWRELGVTTVAELEKAARDHRLAALPGLGEKSEANVLEAAAAYRRRERRFKLSEADQYVDELLRRMRAAPGVRRVEAAGSWRRRRETVGDIDLLAVAADPGPVMEQLTGWDRVERVEGAGGTRATVVVVPGLQVDLRIVPERSFGAAMVYFTGSKEHNIRLRRRAQERGLRLSEYGVFDAGAAEGEGWRAGREEADVYGAVGLAPVPPELREDRGEIEAAERGGLPALVGLEDIRGDLQMHTTASDGSGSLEEMVEACADLGYEYMAVTDHSRSLTVAGGLDAERLRRQWDEMEAVAARHPEIRLLRGMEVDILPDGSLDLEDEMIDGLDVVVVAVHSRFGLPRGRQTRRIVRALEHPRVSVLAHPTGRIIGGRDPYDVDLEEVLQAAASLGVAVELNAQPDRLDLADVHLLRARELGVGVVIDSDAHSPENLRVMRYGVDQARRAWLGPGQVLNTRGADELLDALRGRRR